MATADNRLMTDATGQGILTALQNLAAVQAVPYVASIPTGQWSGSGNDWYITINASNVTANSILIPNYDKDSSELLNGPVWCVPAAGSFTIHTSAIPAGTVTIMVMFAGTMGEAQYQVLDDVYSKDQTDALVAQSTAIEPFSVVISPAITDASSISQNCYYSVSSNTVFITIRIVSDSGLIPTANNSVFTVPSKYRPSDARPVGYAIVCDNKLWEPKVETAYIDKNGVFKLNNFIYGTKTTYLIIFSGFYNL